MALGRAFYELAEAPVVLPLAVTGRALMAGAVEAARRVQARAARTVAAALRRGALTTYSPTTFLCRD